MRSLKFVLATLLIYLTFVFNLERLEWRAGISGTGVHSFVYLLVIAAVLLILFLPHTHNLSVFIFLFIWTLLYFTLRLTIFNDGPIFGGQATYITITELAIILVAIFIVDQSAALMRKYEDFIDEVYLPVRDRRIRQSQIARDDINLEFIRSRRHQHPLSLVAISPEVKNTAAELKVSVKEIQRHMIGRFVKASVAKIITREARRTDLIISLNEDDNLFFILCPETKGSDSINLAVRIQAAVRDRLGIDIDYGVASFPDEALTYEELMNRAEKHLTENRLNPQPLVPPVAPTPTIEAAHD